MLRQLGRRLEQRRTGDAGFTLVEMVVVMSILGLMMSIGIFGFSNWRNTAQQQGTADELVSALRNASTQAVSEGRTYCIQIAADGRSYTRWRTACNGTAANQVGGVVRTQSAAVTLAATVPFPATAALPSPAPACPSGTKCLYFYPRGTAIPAEVVVSSTARSKTYTIRVEGLTARVHQ